jgi:hypothetical protein
VLSGCRKLRVLWLQHCSGTLDGAALAAAAEGRGHRCGLAATAGRNDWLQAGGSQQRLKTPGDVAP